MAFNYNKLRGKIREIFKTQEKFADAMDMSSTSLSEKLNNKVEFSQKEIEKAVELLKIEKDDIPVYFFTLEVQKTELL
jgi:transcriptional regulator with XRE-family HTH domain